MDATRRQPGQEPIPERLTNYSARLPAARRHKDPPRANVDSSAPAKLLTEKEIFHKREWWEATPLLKELSRKEEPLISINETGQANSGCSTHVDTAIKPTVSTNGHHKTAGDNSAPAE